MKSLILLRAQFKRSFIELRRYAFDTISGLVTLYIVFLLVFIGARTLLGGREDVGDTLEAIVVGYMVWMLGIFSYSSTAQNLTEEAQLGTLEQISMSPLGLPWVVALRFVSALGAQLLILFALLFLMMSTTGNWLHLNLATVLPLLILTVMGIQGFGLIAGGLAVVFKRVQSALQIFQFVFVLWIVAPLDRFPWVKYLPLAWGNNLLQRAMREGTFIAALPVGDLGFLVANSVAWFAVGLAIFKGFERVARNRALLGQY